MSSSPAQLLIAFLGPLALRMVAQASQAASLTIANPSFESPAYADGEYDFLISPDALGSSDGAFRRAK